MSHEVKMPLAIKIGLGAFVIFILFIFVAPIFLGGRKPAKMSRAISDMRTLATAMESYFIDHETYPAWTTDLANSAFQIRKTVDRAVYHKLPTFRISENPEQLATLTTPVAFITTLFSDPFSTPTLGQPFCYWKPNDKGWIIWSPGPDGHYDLTIDNIAMAYNPAERNPNRYLLSLTYDPTNGTISAGDRYRLKE